MDAPRFPLFFPSIPSPSFSPPFARVTDPVSTTKREGVTSGANRHSAWRQLALRRINLLILVANPRFVLLLPPASPRQALAHGTEEVF